MFRSEITPAPESLPDRRPSALRRAAVRFVVGGCACAGLVLSTAATSAQTGDETMVETIAAQVGNQIILASEVYELSGPIEERIRAAGLPSSEITRVRREALDRLIEGELLSSVVDRLELNADQEEVDNAIEAIALDNGITLEQLISSVQTHGLTLDEYRTKIQGEIERSKVVNAMVRSRIQISEEEVVTLYAEEFGDQRSGGEEVLLRHILVISGGPEQRSVADACEIAAAARVEIVTGTESFPKVAADISEMNPERGGDLGWMHQTDLAGWMARTIATMEPGQISEVVEMPFGCNLLELVERREFQPVSFDQAKPQLQNIIFQRKTEVEYNNWLDVLRAQTYIERKGPFAVGALDG